MCGRSTTRPQPSTQLIGVSREAPFFVSRLLRESAAVKLVPEHEGSLSLGNRLRGERQDCSLLVEKAPKLSSLEEMLFHERKILL